MAKVNIKGVIVSNDEVWVYEWFEIECTSPNMVNKEIEAAKGEDLEVEINSGGGDVFAGSEIYTALKSYTGKVIVKIVGLAASAASVIAMSGDNVMMSPTAQMMIHNVSTITKGDYRDMEHSAGMLKGANVTIANAYMLKSGMSQKELLSMMNKETWMTPQQALKHNLIDEIMFENEMKLAASFNNSQLLPQEVIDKMRSTIKSPADSQKNEADFLLQKSKLKFLKLKGEMKDE